MLGALRRRIGGVGACPHFGGGGGGTQTSTATTINYSPEEAARREQLAAEAQRVYQNSREAIAGTQYPGSIPTGPSTTTGAAWDMLRGAVPGMQRMANSAAGAVQRTLDPAFLDRQAPGGVGEAIARGTSADILYAGANPYLQSYMGAALTPLRHDYTDPGGVMSSIRTDAGTIAGQGTSTRQGIAEGIAGGRFAQAAGDITSKIASEGYGQGLQHQQAMTGLGEDWAKSLMDQQARMTTLAPGVQQMGVLPGQVLGAVGESQEGYEQAMRDYEASARAWDLNKDWGPLQNLANIIYGAGSSQTTGTQTAPAPRTNAAMSGLGGAAAGASLAGMMSFNPLIGAGLGLMLGLFS